MGTLNPIKYGPFLLPSSQWRKGKVAKKRSGEAGVLFERIGQLGQKLDKQRNRSIELSRLLSETRQENAALAEQIGRLKRELSELKSKSTTTVGRSKDDVRKIRALKGLVDELRSEVGRIVALLPADKAQQEQEKELEAVPVEQQITTETADLFILTGETILIAGWPEEEINYIYRVVWHDGDKVDLKLQALVKKADIFVVLTRFVSHEAMWWMKEAAIDLDRPIYFVRERNLSRILEIVAEKEKARTTAG